MKLVEVGMGMVAVAVAVTEVGVAGVKRLDSVAEQENESQNKLLEGWRRE